MDPVNLRPSEQHVALDAEVADALRVAWLAADIAGLSPETVEASATPSTSPRTRAFYRWPSIRLNQFNWQARLYAAAATSPGDTTLLREDYRRQLPALPRRRASARRGRTTNLNDGLGFVYLPNRPPSQRANRISTSEYGNMAFDGVSALDDALGSGHAAAAGGARDAAARLGRSGCSPASGRTPAT